MEPAKLYMYLNSLKKELENSNNVRKIYIHALEETLKLIEKQAGE